MNTTVWETNNVTIGIFINPFFHGVNICIYKLHNM